MKQLILNFLKKYQVFVWLVLFGLSTLLSGWLLRQNNLKMIELTEKVINIDEGSNGDLELIEPALQELSDYVSSHMNTTMHQPVQLQHRYNKIVDELVKSRHSQESRYRQGVYDRAQANCSSVALSVRVQCVYEYISSQPGLGEFSPPPVEQFSYQFVSPSWSLDRAGVGALVTFLLGLMTVFTVVTEVAIPKILSMFRDDPLE